MKYRSCRKPLKSYPQFIRELTQQNLSRLANFDNYAPRKRVRPASYPASLCPYSGAHEGAPSRASDQSTTLGVISVYHADTVAYSFHRHGIAYTMTTLPDNETWVLPILQSWEFTD
jgi:hypothetical protein